MAVFTERLDMAYREARALSLRLRYLSDLAENAPSTEHSRLADKLGRDYEDIRKLILEGFGILPIIS